MEGALGTIIGGVVLGAAVGALGRLVLPGKQDISLGVMISIGFVGAIIGGVLAQIIGVRETDGIDWIKLALQVGTAAFFVAVYERWRESRSPEQPVASAAEGDQ